MFPLLLRIGITPPRRALFAGSSHGRWTVATLRMGLLTALLAAVLPAGVSAQALGTMQVTARVLPGGPAWAGLAEARVLARQALLSPPATPRTRRAGLVQTRAELTTTAARRRLLVTVQYPRN